MPVLTELNMKYVLTEKEYQELKAAAEKPPEPMPWFWIDAPIPLAELQGRFARAVLERCGGNAVAASKILEIHRHTVAKLKK